MKLLVILTDEIAEQHGVERVIKFDLDALMQLPFADLVALEDAMAGGPALQRIRIDLADYTAKIIRAVAWLALKQAGKDPDWETFQPDLSVCTYLRDVPVADADPPADGGTPAPPSDKPSPASGRRSRTSTASPRTRSARTK